MINYLLNKIKKKKIKIGIVGLGYVGLPLAKGFLDKKIKVYGFDTDRKKIKLLKSEKSYINYVSDSKIKKMMENGFFPTWDLSYISEIDVVILCLPTPIKKNKSPEMKYINNSLNSILPYLKKNQTICLESTTYPGTCEELILPKLKKKFKVGTDFFLIYSPEREDPGNEKYSLGKIPKVLGGFTKNCSKVGTQIYKLLGIKVVKVNDLKTAEFTKLLENIYRSVNIGLINEMKIITEKLGINIYNAIEAASTKPFGFQTFYPGPGYGGHCIPIDPFILAWKANKSGADAKFINLSGLINERMPKIIAEKVLKYSKKFKKKRIFIVGVTYKKNVDDMRESPALKIINLLEKKGLMIDYHDPYVKKIPNLRNYSIKKISKNLTKKNLKNKITLLITDHDNLDYRYLRNNSEIIFDCRGRYKYNLDSRIIQV